MNLERFLGSYSSARKAGTPLVAVRTSDAEATIEMLLALEKQVAAEQGEVGAVAVRWDYLSGSATVAGQVSVTGGESSAAMAVGGFCEPQVPEESVLFMVFADTWINNESEGPVFIQALWNNRDHLKSRRSTIVLLGPGMDRLPVQLQDAYILDEPRPDRERLSQVVTSLLADVGVKSSESDIERTLDALTGLTAFQAEQSVAVSLHSKGINTDRVWDAKREQVRQTPGLSIYGGTETFSDIGGCDAIKEFLSLVLNGQSRPRGIVFIDEIEKAMAGIAGDTSGVSGDQLQALLTHMNDTNAVGMIFVGVPGAAKSAISKAAGNEVGLPTIQLDLGGLKGSLVGQSEGAIRDALKVIQGVCDGRSLWIATSNKLDVIPSELRRRFSLGIYYFDLPSAIERDKIWAIYGNKFKVAVSVRPDDQEWTGDEIRRCCDIAYRTGKSVVECARYIVPVAVSGRAQIEALRKSADGKFLSAATGEVYRIGDEQPQTAKKGRKISLAS